MVKDEEFKYRSRFDILCEFLKRIDEKNLQQKNSMSGYQYTKYKILALNSGLIKPQNDHVKRYVITERGLKFLNLYDEFKRLTEEWQLK